MDERDLWELEFSVEVSTRYHDWRRATMMSMIRSVKGVTFSSAIFTLVTAFDPFHWGGAVVWVVAFFSVLIAGVNLIELVADLMARRFCMNLSTKVLSGYRRKLLAVTPTG